MIWCFAKKLCTRSDAWAGALLCWSCQSPVAHSCGLLNHPNSLDGRMMKLNAKFNADLLLTHSFSFSFLKILFIYFETEGKGGRKQGRETSVCSCLSCAPYWGPGLQPRHVPWLGIELVTLWLSGLCSIHWNIPARALSVIFNSTATQYTCSLNGIYHPNWLTSKWSHHYSPKCIPVHSPWLQG